MHIEQVSKAETVDEMRAEIFRLQQHDPMVRSVMRMADYQGLSAEDRYVILSYHALRELAVMKENTISGWLEKGVPVIATHSDVNRIIL